MELPGRDSSLCIYPFGYNTPTCLTDRRSDRYRPTVRRLCLASRGKNKKKDLSGYCCSPFYRDWRCPYQESIFVFYRATLCVCAVFDVAQCAPVCLSVTLSVMLEHSIHTAEVISNFFVSPVNPSFWFLTPSAGTQFQGNPFSGAQSTRGWENFAISTEIAVYLENSTR